MTRPAYRLLGISGSLRSGSYNTAILRSLAGLIADRAVLTLFPLNDVPLYDGDLDGEDGPPGVARLKQAIGESDGLVICSPEYNFGMPGVLKNALDWASRPAAHTPLKGKPVLIMSASTGALGGARSHSQIRDTLTATRSRVLPRPPVTIIGVKDKMVGGELVDQPTIGFVLDAIADLIREIDLLKGALSGMRSV